jgi:hypothetical protein
MHIGTLTLHLVTVARVLDPMRCYVQRAAHVHHWFSSLRSVPVGILRDKVLTLAGLE